MPREQMANLLLRDCISNWLRDCLLHGVTMGFCPWSSLLDNRSISFLDDASEPTHTRANLEHSEEDVHLYRLENCFLKDWSTRLSLIQGTSNDISHIHQQTPMSSPFRLAIGSVFKELDLKNIWDAYWPNSFCQVFVCCPLQNKRQHCQHTRAHSKHKSNVWRFNTNLSCNRSSPMSGFLCTGQSFCLCRCKPHWAGRSSPHRSPLGQGASPGSRGLPEHLRYWLRGILRHRTNRSAHEGGTPVPVIKHH